jgi:Na+/proline symporter
MRKVLNMLLGSSFIASMLRGSRVVLAYTLAGGLTNAVYNEVLLFLIVMGFAPLAWAGGCARSVAQTGWLVGCRARYFPRL